MLIDTLLWTKRCVLVTCLHLLFPSGVMATPGAKPGSETAGGFIACYDSQGLCSEIPCPCEGACLDDPHCPPGYVCRIEPLGPSSCVCAMGDNGPGWGGTDDLVGRCEPEGQPTGPRGYTLSDIGTLGGPSAVAWAINNAGQVAGRSSNANLISRPFLWEKDAMFDLAPGFPSDSVSQVYLNNVGQVVFRVTSIGTYLWEAGRALRTIGDGTEMRIDINDLGQVLLNERLWHNGTSVEVSALSDPPLNPSALNNLGHIAGSFEAPDGRRPGLLIDGEVFEIGNFAGAGNGPPVSDVNDLGQAALSIYFWTGEEVIELSELARCPVNAPVINNCGEMLIYAHLSCVEEGWTTVGLYSPAAGTYRPMETLIDASLRWYFTFVNDINDRGQIVGSGLTFVPDWGWMRRGFLLTPVPGDLNLDGAIDLNDYAHFFERFGTETTDYSVYCNRADFDHDGLTALADYAEFQRLFTGNQ
jgi:probable HAF family extracellular repeat protein